MQLTQGELFDRTLEDKIMSLQRWMGRLEKQLWFLKSVHDMRIQQKNEISAVDISKIQQMELFKEVK